MFLCLLSAVSHAYAVFASIETCIKCTCCKFLWRVNTFLEIYVWSRFVTMMMLNEHRRTTVTSA